MALTKVSTDGVKDDAITSGKIPANAVGASELADNAVDTNAIANNAITQQKIGADAVQGTIIADNSISTSKIADNAVTTAKLASGATDLVNDSSPQLGGNLDVNTKNIVFGDSAGASDDRLTFGDGTDLSIYHQASNSTSYLLNNSTDLTFMTGGTNVNIKSDTGETLAKFVKNGTVELYHDNVKQLETTENGILLPKGCIRGVGGSKVILGGTLNPSQDVTWNFSFGSNDNGYNNGYIFNIKFYVNHWNHGDYYKYIESISGGRGNTTGLQRVDLINNLGTGSANWSNGHLDYSVSLTGGTRDGSGVNLFKVTYDADGAPSYTSGYYLEVSYSNQIGTISIT